jgi:hypothetical protein
MKATAPGVVSEKNRSSRGPTLSTASREEIREAFRARKRHAKRPCELCEREFEPKRISQKFCSDKCRRTFWNLKREIETAQSAGDEKARLLEAGQ